MTAHIDPKELDLALMGVMNKHGDVKLKSCEATDVAKILLFLASDD